MIVAMFRRALRNGAISETVAMNAGYQVKVFNEKNAAIAWLFRR